MLRFLVLALSGFLLSGCLASSESAEGRVTYQIQGTTVQVSVEASDHFLLGAWDKTVLSGKIVNVGPTSLSYTNAGCPREAFLFDVVVAGERTSVVPARDRGGSTCVTIPMQLDPGDSVTFSEPWKGEIWGGDENVRLGSGSYEVIGWLNNAKELRASVRITIR